MQIKKREVITYLSYPTCKVSIHTPTKGVTKNPLYYWRSIGGISHYCSEMQCSKSTTKISNNSETTKNFIIFFSF